MHLHVLHHVLPHYEPAVTVRALEHLLAVVDLAVAVEHGGLSELNAADVAPYHHFPRWPYLWLAIG